ncbi:MAG: GerMN domain-containing protein [Terracidiphilus sp.]
MIPRHQTILFIVLLITSVVMGVVLWQLRERAHQRLVAGQDSAPTRAPEVAPAEQATLFVANDADSSLLAQIQSLPLPQDPGARARAVLGKLFDLYAAPDAAHPVPGGAGSVAQVFLLPAQTPNTGPDTGPDTGPGMRLDTGPDARLNRGSRTSKSTASNPSQTNSSQSGPELAVVNLTGSFAASHPSGLETETLTLLSICATLHANLPRVTQVRFLVDGQQRATLAGHADLTRTYLAAEAVPRP